MEIQNVINHPPKAKAIGVLLLSQFFLCFALTDLGLQLGVAPSAILFPIALGLPIGVLLLLDKFHRTATAAGAWSLLIWALAIVVATPLRDCSADGNFYHQEIVAALCNGWIPGQPNPSGLAMNLWSYHYAIGLEIAAATVVKAVGLLEAGKSVNIILCLIPGFMIYSFCRSYFPALGHRARLAVAIAAVCNPVCIMQMLTYYVDFAKYVYTVVAIMLLIDLCSRRSLGDLIMLEMVIILSVATKFNAFFEIGVVCFATIIWLILHRRGADAMRLAVFSAVCAMVGVAIFCRHPYITNYITAGHPLYPLMGEGAIDIMTGNTPSEFADGNRVVNFFRSLFSITRLSTDTRAGGFGFLMVPLLLLAGVALWEARKQHTAGPLSLYIGAWVFGSCFFFEQSWWARYICQLWILVPLGLVMVLTTAHGAGHSQRIIGPWGVSRAIAVLVGLSVLFCGATALLLSAKVTMYRSVVYSHLQGETLTVHGLRESFLRQMQEAGITAVSVDTISPRAYRFPYYGPVSQPDFYPIILLDSAKAIALRHEIDKLPLDYNALFVTEPETNSVEL